LKIRDILVPVDFSPNSLEAVRFAVNLGDPEGEIYLLHVIDSDFVRRLSEEGFQSEDSAIELLRQRASDRMNEILKEHSQLGGRMNSMIVVGKPFAEILRVAVDLDFEMIVLGIHGRHKSDIEQLLFGSTAEKVLRGAANPVVCVPYRQTP
jgi:nucleotide-binding universal stress UspA family protein